MEWAGGQIEPLFEYLQARPVGVGLAIVGALSGLFLTPESVAGVGTVFMGLGLAAVLGGFGFGFGQLIDHAVRGEAAARVVLLWFIVLHPVGGCDHYKHIKRGSVLHRFILSANGAGHTYRDTRASAVIV